jgi:hypothetical protein
VSWKIDDCVVKAVEALSCWISVSWEIDEFVVKTVEVLSFLRCTLKSSISQDTEIQQDKASTVFTTQSSISQDTEIHQDKTSTVFTTNSSISQDTEIQQDKASTVFTTKSSVFQDTEIQQDKASTGFTLYIEIIDFAALSCLCPGHIVKLPRLTTISLQNPSTLVGMYMQKMFPSVYLYLLWNDYF